MSHEDPGNVSFGEVGGLSEQIRELREVNDFFYGKIETIEMLSYRSWNYL
jgi:ATP-dependent 26S proteasome regulatory subunit